MVFVFLTLITALTVVGLELLHVLMRGSSFGRRAAVIVSFLSFLAWSWTMAYYIVGKK